MQHAVAVQNADYDLQPYDDEEPNDVSANILVHDHSAYASTTLHSTSMKVRLLRVQLHNLGHG